MMNWLMNLHIHCYRRAWAVVLALAVAGCATDFTTTRAPAATQAQQISVLQARTLDPALEDRILALNPERITEQEVRSTLSLAPAPRIVLLHGGIYPVHLAMISFGGFLVDMGYPAVKIRHPGDGSYSHSPYENSERLAGLVAWYYERDGLRPMLIGHSQGGMQAIKVLRELDGQFSDRVPVWNPLTDTREDRFTIVDPFTGKERPVVGLSVSYASAVGAGGWALLLPNQWNMIGKLRTIPDTVEEFTGFFIDVDFFAWMIPGTPDRTVYRNNGTAKVRNVTLPATYNHVFVPVTQQFAADPQLRERINAYVPGVTDPAPYLELGNEGLLWAADVWHSIKKHWTLEAQRLIRAQRAAALPR